MRSKIIKQEAKLSSVVYPLEGFISMGVKAIKLRNCVICYLKVIFILMGNYSTF